VKEVCQTDIKNEIISFDLEGEISHIRPHALSLIPLFHLNFCPSKRFIEPKPFRKFKICCFHPFFDEEKGLTEEMKNDLRIKKAMCCKWTGNVFRFCGKRQRNDELPICSKEEMVEGIIVVGGHGGFGGHNRLDSAELLINNNHHCYLPPIPQSRNSLSLTSKDGSSNSESLLLCGGFGYPNREFIMHSCLKFNQGTWDVEPYTLKERRWRHRAVHTDAGVLLIGGGELGSNNSTEIAGGQEIFNLNERFDAGCIIEDTNNEFILSGSVPGTNIVARYNAQGFISYMPSLINKRYSHACGMIYKDEKKIYVVAGGGGGSNLDSTEILKEDATAWQISNPLPRKMWAMASISYKNYMVMIGGYIDGSKRDEVLSFNGNEWTEVGKLDEARATHAAAKVKITEFLKSLCM